MLEAEVHVTLKKTVSDSQGLTVKHALESLGCKNLEEVRIGKLITIRLDSQDKKNTQEKIDEMCRKLLSNPVIEDYSFQIREV